MRIAVTGSSGFIGRHVTASLTARGDDVVPVRRPFAAPTLTEALRGADVVVHLAGVVSTVREREFFEANVGAARAVAEATRAAGATLVHISSLAAAGPAPPNAPRSEDDPPSPINAYGRSKLEGERAIAAVDGLHWTMLRPGVVYGPGDRALLPLFTFARRGILPLVGRADAAYTFVHISDLVRAITAAVDRPAAGDTMFVGHPLPVGTREILEGVRTAAGARAAIIRIPMALTYVAALAGDVAGRLTGKAPVINSRRYAELASVGFVCRVDRLRDHLGIVAQIGLTEGLADAYAWYQREGWV
ncbi:MAG TPA: NAD-dependent epimerase/dehydratase family protein [Vicinamibacterales bacterium]|nr:NAD-dependent epimerase/dehydratase family protein [Vicinamibacterales bacterium]